jgi:hypothetical protein
VNTESESEADFTGDFRGIIRGVFLSSVRANANQARRLAILSVAAIVRLKSSALVRAELNMVVCYGEAKKQIQRSFPDAE